MTKKSIIFLLILFFTFIFPKLALADTIGEALVSVGPDETIDNNFVRFGQTVDIKGTVNGDVVTAGVSVNISGKVGGDVIAAANNLTISGEVAGNVRVAGGSVILDAKIGKNANVFAQSFSATENNQVGWSMYYASQTADINGSISGHLDGGAQTTSVGAKVGGNANIYSNEENGKISLVSPAVIKGNLTYSGPNVPVIQPGAEVKGELVKKPSAAPIQKDKLAKFFGISSIFLKVIKLFSLLVIGLVIITLFSKRVGEIIDQMKKEPLKNLGWGLVYLIVTPIVCLLLLFTIIGIPLALILAALYLIALYVSKVFVGVLIGWWIIDYFQKNKKDKKISLMLAMILGVVVFSLLIIIPYLGWLIGLAGTIWALGALGEFFKKQKLTNSK